MAYETITVRMNRSSDTIPWGFTVSGGGSMPIKISSLQKESLADKAGLQVGDAVTEFSGRDTKGMSLQEARNIVERGSFAINMLLQRHVTEHSCLPWQLTEKDNQITVDHIKPQTAINYNSYKRERTDKYTTHTTSNYEVPVRNESFRYRTSSESKREESPKNRPHNLGYQPAPFTNVTNTGSSYVGKVRQKEGGFQNSYTTNTSRTESRNTSGYGSSGGGGGGSVSRTRNVPVAFGSSAPSSAAAIPLPAPTSNAAGGVGGKSYTPMHVDTSHAYNDVGYHSPRAGGGYHTSATSTKSPRQDHGPRVSFQHSPRTERELSPHATVRHLQYNSPMNIYSPQSAAEQYLQQTGGLFGTDPLLQQPKGDEAYLKSETRRLIAEEEGEGAREKSPAMQSASFKRISRACGTPVD